MLALVVLGTGASAAPNRYVRDPGLDMIMIDAGAMPAEPELAADQPQVEDVSWTGAPVGLLKPALSKKSLLGLSRG
jgi:hypothetical protein